MGERKSIGGLLSILRPRKQRSASGRPGESDRSSQLSTDNASSRSHTATPSPPTRATTKGGGVPAGLPPLSPPPLNGRLAVAPKPTLPLPVGAHGPGPVSGPVPGPASVGRSASKHSSKSTSSAGLPPTTSSTTAPIDVPAGAATLPLPPGAGPASSRGSEDVDVTKFPLPPDHALPRSASSKVEENGNAGGLAVPRLGAVSDRSRSRSTSFLDRFGGGDGPDLTLSNPSNERAAPPARAATMGRVRSRSAKPPLSTHTALDPSPELAVDLPPGAAPAKKHILHRASSVAFRLRSPNNSPPRSPSRKNKGRPASMLALTPPKIDVQFDVGNMDMDVDFAKSRKASTST